MALSKEDLINDIYNYRDYLAKEMYFLMLEDVGMSHISIQRRKDAKYIYGALKNTINTFFEDFSDEATDRELGEIGAIHHNLTKSKPPKTITDPI